MAELNKKTFLRGSSTRTRPQTDQMNPFGDQAAKIGKVINVDPLLKSL